MPDPGEPQPLFLLSDEPIAGYTDDGLEMHTFRDVITGTVLGSVGPFTIGVYGRWGEGKTSLLRAAESQLRASMARAMGSDERPTHPYVVPVWFNPWQYESEEHPLVPLVAEIERAVAKALAQEETITEKFGQGAVKALKGIGVASLLLLRSASFKAKVKAGVACRMSKGVQPPRQWDGGAGQATRTRSRTCTILRNATSRYAVMPCARAWAIHESDSQGRAVSLRPGGRLSRSASAYATR